jgi:hypothetical protein
MSADPSTRQCFPVGMSKRHKSYHKTRQRMKTICYKPSGLGLPLLFPHRSATGSIPDIPSPPHCTLYRCCRCIKSRPNIKIEYWLACGLDPSGVVVNHISNLSSACWSPSSDVPIMAVERWFSPARSPSVKLRSVEDWIHQPVFLRKHPSQGLQNGRLGRPITRPAHKSQ